MKVTTTKKGNFKVTLKPHEADLLVTLLQNIGGWQGPDFGVRTILIDPLASGLIDNDAEDFTHGVDADDNIDYDVLSESFRTNFTGTYFAYQGKV